MNDPSLKFEEVEWPNDTDELPQILHEKSRSTDNSKVNPFPAIPAQPFSFCHPEPCPQAVPSTIDQWPYSWRSTNVSASFASNDYKPLVQQKKPKKNKCSNGDSNDDDEFSDGSLHNGETERKKKRLERNRKCAKESRRKKKEYIHNLEEQVTSIRNSYDLF